jgi:hypothetical protein
MMTCKAWCSKARAWCCSASSPEFRIGCKICTGVFLIVNVLFAYGLLIYLMTRNLTFGVTIGILTLTIVMYIICITILKQYFADLQRLRNEIREQELTKQTPRTGQYFRDYDDDDFDTLNLS